MYLLLMSDRVQRDILEHAERYAARGWPVFPVSRSEEILKTRPINQGKIPLNFFSFLFAGTDLRRFRKNLESAGQRVNLGIKTGKRFGLVVIDVDFDKGGRESMERLRPNPTRTVITANGIHLYYRYPAGARIPTSQSSVGKGIDVRSDHRFIVAPPSLHASGHVYRWEDETVPIAEMDEHLVRAVERGVPKYTLLRDLYRMFWFIHITPLVGKIRRFLAMLGWKSLAPSRG